MNLVPYPVRPAVFLVGSLVFNVGYWWPGPFGAVSAVLIPLGAFGFVLGWLPKDAAQETP